MPRGPAVSTCSNGRYYTNSAYHNMSNSF